MKLSYTSKIIYIVSSNKLLAKLPLCGFTLCEVNSRKRVFSFHACISQYLKTIIKNFKKYYWLFRMTKLTIQSIVQHFLYIKYDLSSIIYRIFNDALLIINFNLDTFSLLIIANYFLFIIQSLYLLIYKKYARFNNNPHV